MSITLVCPDCQKLLRRGNTPEKITATLGGKKVTLLLEDAPVWCCPTCDYRLCDEECMTRRRASFRMAVDWWWYEQLREAGGAVAEITKLRQLFVRIAARHGNQAVCELGIWLGRDVKGPQIEDSE